VGTDAHIRWLVTFKCSDSFWTFDLSQSLKVIHSVIIHQRQGIRWIKFVGIHTPIWKGFTKTMRYPESSYGSISVCLFLISFHQLILCQVWERHLEDWTFSSITWPGTHTSGCSEILGPIALKFLKLLLFQFQPTSSDIIHYQVWEIRSRLSKIFASLSFINVTSALQSWRHYPSHTDLEEMLRDSRWEIKETAVLPWNWACTTPWPSFSS
jgi:hypothetical protein